MDRETRVFAERHFRGLHGCLPGGACRTPERADFIEKPDSFSYADFFKGYLLPNLPCVFSSAFTEGWGSRRHWVTRSGKPDFDYLLQKYGDMVVPVANCGVQEYNSNPKEHMPLRDYISYWKEYIQENYSSPRGCLYLKDWHLCRQGGLPQHGPDSCPVIPLSVGIHRVSPMEDVYTLPVYFSSDWLNEYWDTLNVDDYRFVYMGPAGTWSPFHADIFRSFSWSVNICGRKKWLLFPPGQEEALRDRHGSLPYDVTSPALLDTRLYPSHMHCEPPLEITQEAGEMLFVPSGWHHQVHNLPCPAPSRRTPSPSTTTGSMAVTWQPCGASYSGNSRPCSRRSTSGETPCWTGTTTARSSLKGGSSPWPTERTQGSRRVPVGLGWAPSKPLLTSAGSPRCWPQ
ncbi:2-oxoglutarate and iron-dependent oxygenase JMJD4-like isoform X6 [Choloepus didactylus]|uniref:2-oxoglutarate and iron-dependent oxygenase JMJD4-like isoform X6 n=2 Tax=Choloepus didactylus TaxID=27675 RepID=UPI00189CFBD0|nr:2-oxoglutarate and iron-dependent oxygenase JMJD4-like isoform X6 [Choloepus didactylus]